MRRITVVSACLMLGAALPLAAQKDTREAKALKLPSARSTAVADAAEQGDLAAVKRLGPLLGAAMPHAEDDVNELPDQMETAR